MKQVLKCRRFANVAEIQLESLAALDSISVEDFRHCFQQGSIAGIAASCYRGSALKETKV